MISLSGKDVVQQTTDGNEDDNVTKADYNILKEWHLAENLPLWHHLTLKNCHETQLPSIKQLCVTLDLDDILFCPAVQRDIMQA